MAYIFLQTVAKLRTIFLSPLFLLLINYSFNLVFIKGDFSFLNYDCHKEVLLYMKYKLIYYRMLESYRIFVFVLMR
jgi:hypothetical protein